MKSLYQPPPAPRTEFELKEICQLPDRVKELQPFDGPRPSPPRPLGPKPNERMEVDESVQSRTVNYMNRPSGFKRGAKSDNFRNPFKQQKLFNTYTEQYDHFPYFLENGGINERL
ncbi:hypothetical protein EVAR_91064_1 [Eumeta japonica]|uniref:Uncharacterized protein n=1 Tax=Eumeta variegata TaxID=151549 RepID=A0A4C1SEF8_EUMVA|nr:hypothetical protein EVAR_91064_1 [Eumeta japonica]